MQTQHHQAADSGTRSAESVFHEGRLNTTQAAPEQGLVDAEASKGAVRPATGAHQVKTAAATAPVPLWVVFGEAVKPGLAILRMRLSLLQLRAQIGVLSLKRPDAISQKGQALAQHRRTAALVDERLNLLEQRLKHFVFSRGVAAGDRTGEVA